MGKSTALNQKKGKAIGFSQAKLDSIHTSYEECLSNRIYAESATIFYEIKLSLLILDMSDELLKDKKNYANSSTNKKLQSAYEEKMSELTGFRRDKLVKYRKQGKWARQQSWYNNEFLGLDKNIDWKEESNETVILGAMMKEYRDNFLSKQSEDFLRRHGNLHPDTRDKLKKDFDKLNPAKPKPVSTTTTSSSSTTTETQVTPEQLLKVNEALISTPTESDTEATTEYIPEVTTELPDLEPRPVDTDDQDTLLSIIDSATDDYTKDELIEFRTEVNKILVAKIQG
tara:strand:+ start:170 stop:1024 length:855 start_codon:yes stop_codon:yes gene_type:complete